MALAGRVALIVGLAALGGLIAVGVATRSSADVVVQAGPTTLATLPDTTLGDHGITAG